ncbi:MAG: hypothetical protein N0E59_01980 [Candidatus Thiodiazotropha taylori]|nr:hypothetical protein [Candidatus Thiodiazotropha taylori]MCG8092616.1 hypothetical protein [Candidatus Thiodiazotropha endolucinida]MCG8109510.1 hypothetical protein [Candidatus Thiodiazotropha taylori]MCW4281851.1 hypothetical protein [Candidatus Thiodiazotropha taylori]MCW4305955.1 hypothetical protein [Candidatus Thiodiazotropha taylori]
MSTKGRKTPKGRLILRREASSDDPIYNRDFLIGAKRTKSSPDRDHETIVNSCTITAPDRDILKSLWISLKAEQLGKNQVTNPESSELLEESADMEWFVTYESCDDLENTDDPIMKAAIERFKSVIGYYPFTNDVE